MSNLSPKVLLVGIGNIGYRHLESLICYESNLEIYIFDISFKRCSQVKEELEKRKSSCVNIYILNSLVNLQSI